MTNLTTPIQTTPNELRTLFEQQQRAFARQAPLSAAARMQALASLLDAVLAQQETLCAAVDADFGGRAREETRLLELFPLVDEIRYVRRRIRRWMRDQPVRANWQFLPSRARIVTQPLGVVGILGAWNYPLLLTLSPLVNALSAGNHVLLKPSESAPHTAKALQHLLAAIFPPDYVAVVLGGRELAGQFSALPFDHLLFTGSGSVARSVMRVAADHLTPVTLELGGKSPALVHASFPMRTAADRICSAKFWNAGQTCVAPDYALVPAARLDEFVQACLAAIALRFPRAASSPAYTHMISAAAHARMAALVADARATGATVHESEPPQPGSTAYPPTLIVRPGPAARVLAEEIFGPLLPIVPYDSLDEALTYINARPRPLALYYFDRDRARIRRVLRQTTSGGVTVNDCIFHLPQHRLPFGGVGPSGMGAYHGHDGFLTFSKRKGVLLQSPLTASVLARAFKPPYTRLTTRLLALLTGRARRSAFPKPPAPSSF